MPIDGLKPKDLVGAPWRVAFALQADGWWLRSDVVWEKPNPMPESVRDRPTRAHEYVFLLAKSERYHYDAMAIAEAATMRPSGNKARTFGGEVGDRPNDHLARGVSWDGSKTTRNARTVWKIAPQNFKGAHFATFPEELARRCVAAGCPVGGTVLDPFFGAGTVGLVAAKSSRSSIGVEINPEYAQMAAQRIRDGAGILTTVDISQNS